MEFDLTYNPNNVSFDLKKTSYANMYIILAIVDCKSGFQYNYTVYKGGMSDREFKRHCNIDTLELHKIYDKYKFVCHAKKEIAEKIITELEALIIAKRLVE